MKRRSQIKDFFEGRLTEPEAKELLEWLHSAEGEEFLSTEIDQIWAEKIRDREYKELDTEELWQKIKVNSSTYPKPVLMKSIDKSKKPIPIWLKVACSLILLGVSVWVVLHSYPQPEVSPGPSEEAVEMVSKYNPPGQKTKIHLQDGSIVFLNSDSKITHPADFLSNRQIVLEGEAYFTVSKDTLHPFRVKARGITTTALGTAFNVSTFNKDEKVKITLVSGKVKLNKEGNGNHLILAPGEESIVSETEQEFHKNQVDVTKRIVWIDGILTFESTPFNEVIDLLERWYGVKIEVKGKVARSLCSGTFQNNEMLDNVLDVLSSSVGFEYKLNGKKVVINF
jgi:ferric-dicitrate binding protein FerR (iron transport regulator)